MKKREKYHDDWETPKPFYDKLNDIYHFDFDPCPLRHDMSWDGLQIDWLERNFINPPYSQAAKESFVLKALDESRKGKLCVLLLPVSTSTKLFHDIILPNAKKIEFIRGRIPFIGVNDKGQIVNHPNPTKERTIGNRKNPHVVTQVPFRFQEYEDIPLHVRQSGQHDSFLVIFDGR